MKYLTQEALRFGKETGYKIHIAQVYTKRPPSRYRVYRLTPDALETFGLDHACAAEITSEMTGKETIHFLNGLRIGLLHTPMDYTNPAEKLKLGAEQ